MRVPFNSVFTLIDGRIITKNHVAFGSVTVAAGTSILPILPIAGIRIGTITDCDLSVENEDGIRGCRKFCVHKISDTLAYRYMSDAMVNESDPPLSQIDRIH
jgi:hypothetical protein